MADKLLEQNQCMAVNEQPRRGWRDVPSSVPWVQALNNEMRAANTPVLTGKEIIIASDSSGLHRASPFEVLGLVVIDFDASLKWDASRQILRKHVLKDSRRMSLKKLDEPMRRNALIPFLRSADDIQGMCLCVGIHKGITTLGGPPELRQQLTQTQILKASWSQASFDRMSRTAHFISLIMAGLLSEGQNITWISDEDEMFESPNKSEDTRRLISTFSSIYVKWKPGRLGIGTTKLDEGDRFEEDMSAIADLSAGAFCEFLAMLHEQTGGQVSAATDETSNGALSGKADFLLSWLFDNSHSLKRVSLVFHRRSDGKFRINRVGI